MSNDDIPKVVMTEAKGFLMDIGAFRSKMTNGQVISAVRRYYHGGWPQFLKDTAGLHADVA